METPSKPQDGATPIDAPADAIEVISEVSTRAAQLLLHADFAADPLATLRDSRQTADGAFALATDTVEAIAARLMDAGVPFEDLNALVIASGHRGAASMLSRIAAAAHDQLAEAHFDAAFGVVAGHA